MARSSEKMWLKSFTQLRLRQWFTFQFTLLYTVSQLNQCSYNYGVCLIKCLYLHSFPLVALRKMEDRNDCRWPQLNAVWWGFLFPCGTPVTGTSLRFGSNGELVTAVHVHSNNSTKSYLQDIDMYLWMSSQQLRLVWHLDIFPTSDQGVPTRQYMSL